MVKVEMSCTLDAARSLVETIGELAGTPGVIVAADTRVRVQVPARILDATLRAKEGAMKVSLSFRDSTGAIHIQTGGVLEDQMKARVIDLDMLYAEYLATGEMQPAPPGAEHVVASFRRPAYHSKMNTIGGPEASSSGQSTATPPRTQADSPARVPNDQEFQLAVADIGFVVRERLNNYPRWRDRLLQTLLIEYGMPQEIRVDGWETVHSHEDIGDGEM